MLQLKKKTSMKDCCDVQGVVERIRIEISGN